VLPRSDTPGARLSPPISLRGTPRPLNRQSGPTPASGLPQIDQTSSHRVRVHSHRGDHCRSIVLACAPAKTREPERALGGGLRFRWRRSLPATGPSVALGQPPWPTWPHRLRRVQDLPELRDLHVEPTSSREVVREPNERARGTSDRTWSGANPAGTHGFLASTARVAAARPEPPRPSRRAAGARCRIGLTGQRRRVAPASVASAEVPLAGARSRTFDVRREASEALERVDGQIGLRRVRSAIAQRMSLAERHRYQGSIEAAAVGVRGSER